MEVIDLTTYPDGWLQESSQDGDDGSDDDGDDASCYSIDSNGTIFDPDEDFTHEIKAQSTNCELLSPESNQENTPDCEQEIEDAESYSEAKEEPILVDTNDSLKNTKETTTMHTHDAVEASDPSLKNLEQQSTTIVEAAELEKEIVDDGDKEDEIESEERREDKSDDDDEGDEQNGVTKLPVQPIPIQNEKLHLMVHGTTQSIPIAEVDPPIAPPPLMKPTKIPLSPKQKKWKKRIVANKNKKEQKKNLPKELENPLEQDDEGSDSSFQEDSSRASTLESIPETDEETDEKTDEETVETEDTPAPSIESLENTSKASDVDTCEEEDIEPTKNEREDVMSLEDASLQEVFDYSNDCSEEYKEDEANNSLKASDTEAVDETGLDPKDIALVMFLARCTDAKAVTALKENDGDLVDSIMSLRNFACEEEDIVPTKNERDDVKNLEDDNKSIEQGDIKLLDAVASMQEVFDYSNDSTEDETNQVQDEVLVTTDDIEPIAPILAHVPCAEINKKENVDEVLIQELNDNSEDTKEVDELEVDEGGDEDKTLYMLLMRSSSDKDIEHTLFEASSNDRDEDESDEREQTDDAHLEVQEDSNNDASSTTESEESKEIESSGEENVFIPFAFESQADKKPPTVQSTDVPESPTRKKWSKRIVANKERKEKENEIGLCDIKEFAPQKSQSELVCIHVSAAGIEATTEVDPEIEEVPTDVGVDLEKCPTMEEQSELISEESATAPNQDLQNDAPISVCGDPSSWLKRSSKNKPWYIKPIEPKKGSDATAKEESTTVTTSSNECTSDAIQNDEEDEVALLLNENAGTKRIEEDTTITTALETLDDSINGVMGDMDSEDEDDESIPMNEAMHSDDDESESLEGLSTASEFEEEPSNASTDDDANDGSKPNKLVTEENDKDDVSILNLSEVESTSSHSDTESSHDNSEEETEETSFNEIHMDLSDGSGKNGQMDESNTMDSSEEKSHHGIKLDEEEIESTTCNQEVDTASNTCSSDDYSGKTEVSEESSATREEAHKAVPETTLEEGSVEEGTKFSIDSDFSEILDLFEEMKLERNERTVREVAEILDVFGDMKNETKPQEESVNESSVDSPESGESTVGSKKQEKKESGEYGSCVFIETQNKDEIDETMSALSGSMRTISTNRAMVEEHTRDVPSGSNKCTDTGDDEFWKWKETRTSSAAAKVVLDSRSENETKEEQSLTTPTATSAEENVSIETVSKDGEVAIVVQAQDWTPVDKTAEISPTGNENEFWNYLCCCVAASNSCKNIPWYVMPEADPATNLEEIIHGNGVSRRQIMRDLSQSQTSKDGSSHDDRVMELVLYDHQ